MGNLLGSPVTDKETVVGETDDGYPYGMSTMQGWRVHMEDAHICEPRLYAEEPGRVDGERFHKIPLPGHSLFAVFDGHGGSFAAYYSGLNLCRILSRQPQFVQYAKFVQERAEKERTMDAHAKAKYVRSGLEMLESALHDAFIDIDREILLAVQGSPVVEANQPYHHNSNPASDNPGNSDSHPDPQPSDDEDAGTTASVLMITPQWVICANAGDSRAVFSKNGNKAVPLSYDHKPDDESEETRIREAGGYVAGGRVEGDLAVSRGWGDYRFKDIGTVLLGSPHTRHIVKQMKKGKQQTIEPMMEPDDQKVSPVPDIIVQTRNKESDEFLVIACDGIFDVMTNQDCVKTVADMFAEGETNMGLICEELLDICLQLGSKDNMSAIIVKFDAQEIGEGGGVQHRRKIRKEVDEKNDKGKKGGAKKVQGNGGDVEMDEDEIEHDS